MIQQIDSNFSRLEPLRGDPDRFVVEEQEDNVRVTERVTAANRTKFE